MILTLAIAESAIGLLQCFGYLPSENNLFPMTGTFKNPGPLGGFVTVGLSIAIPCLSLIMTRDQKEAGRLSCLVKIASLLTFFLGMVVLPASMSRAAWLALIVALSLFAYKEKNEYVLYKVPKNFLLTSATPSISNFKLSQGFALEIIYQRVASGPYSAKVVNGSTAFPKRLDIFCPSLSKTNPFETTFL